MIRDLRVTLAVLVLAGGFAALGLAEPGSVYACTCAPPQPIADYAAFPDTLVLAGTVMAIDQDQLGTFRVERWYNGFRDGIEVPIRGGNGSGCGVFLYAEQRMLIVARDVGGVLRTLGCATSADLATPDGERLLAEVVAAFGEGTSPRAPVAASPSDSPAAASPSASPGDTAPPGAGVDLPSVAVAAGLALAIVMLVAIGLRAFRQRS